MKKNHISKPLQKMFKKITRNLKYLDQNIDRFILKPEALDHIRIIFQELYELELKTTGITAENMRAKSSRLYLENPSKTGLTMPNRSVEESLKLMFPMVSHEIIMKIIEEIKERDPLSVQRDNKRAKKYDLGLDFSGWTDENKEQFEIYRPVIKKIMKLAKNATVLDFGCGPGGFAIPLSYFAAQIHAIDRNRTIRAAERNIEQIPTKDKITFTTFRGRLLPYSDEQFDIILCAHVPEWIESKDELFRVLKREGKLITVSANKINIILKSNVRQQETNTEKSN